jgi:hypothetical protein
MIDATAGGSDVSATPGDSRIEVEVEDVYGTIANATVRSAVHREYVQLVRTPEGWKVVNALSEWTSRRSRLRARPPRRRASWRTASCPGTAALLPSRLAVHSHCSKHVQEAEDF